MDPLRGIVSDIAFRTRRPPVPERRKKKDVTVASTTVVEGSGGIVWLEEPVTVASVAGIVNWTVYTLTDLPDAKSVLLETVWEIHCGDNPSEAQGATLKVRKPSGTTVYTAAKVFLSGGDKEVVGGVDQSWVPVDSEKRFEYAIEGNGFNNGATVRLIAYMA